MLVHIGVPKMGSQADPRAVNFLMRRVSFPSGWSASGLSVQGWWWLGCYWLAQPFLRPGSKQAPLGRDVSVHLTLPLQTTELIDALIQIWGKILHLAPNQKQAWTMKEVCRGLWRPFTLLSCYELRWDQYDLIFQFLFHMSFWILSSVGLSLICTFVLSK